MPLDPFALSVIFIGLGLGAIVKSFAGAGLPLVAVPFMSIFLGVEHAVVVIQIPNIISNLWLIYANRSKIKETPLHLELVIPSAVAVFIGVWFLSFADRELTGVLLAGFLGIFLILIWLKPEFKLSGLTNKIVTPAVSILGGFIQGSAGASQPIYSPLLYSLRLSRESFLLYNGLLFGFFNTIQVFGMLIFGMFTSEHLRQGLLALIPLFIFQYAGMKVSGRISRSSSNRLVLIILIAIEMKLIWDVFTK